MRKLITRRGTEHSLPLFLPVYQPQSPIVPLSVWGELQSVEGCILNAFFLYKNRDIRKSFGNGLTLREYLNFDGLVMTDSGAFQALTGPLLLSNKAIVTFQEMIKTDIASPLDLISPPGENRTTAEQKLIVTLKRIREALALTPGCILAGVQQGGRFPDLRRRSLEGLMELGIEYLAIGSLVPFFNKNHDLKFVGPVLREARRIAGPQMPIHVYGAGDPVELPFLVALGADIFDSSSYAHSQPMGFPVHLSQKIIADLVPQAPGAGMHQHRDHIFPQSKGV
ncbi:MAG: tRNA-guanine transglycosylase, partial [Deltaproteobacteria bacterium]|nr:tRNA-guanine transglycosylase [Deltaproteobacteria bacterium]